MHPLSIFLIALAMSSDAFAAAIGKGVAMRHPRFSDALRAGIIFGIIEAITPILGWLLGRVASAYISTWDHWIAFALLSILGARMIHAGLVRDRDDRDLTGQRDGRTGVWALAVTGFATSIDAMAVGVGLAFMDVSIVAVSLAIGAITLVMVTAGILLGRVLGHIAGKRAEIVGGIILICVGAGIVYQHLSAA